MYQFKTALLGVVIVCVQGLILAGCGGGGGDSSGNTPPGTPPDHTIQMLQDITTTSVAYSSDIRDIVELGGWLYYTASNGTTGIELWRYDGATSEQVADINPGEGSSWPRHLTVMNGYIYFSAEDPTHGTELWRTNGMITERVADINASGGSYPANFVVFNDYIYFSANNDVPFDPTFWRSNGIVTEPVPGAESRRLYSQFKAVVFGGYLYFPGGTGTSERIYRTDGTTTAQFSMETSTSNIITISPNNWEFAVYNGALYFQGTTGSAGTELFRTDGINIELVMDINSPGSSSPLGFTEFDGQLYFVASSGSARSVWRSNGTTTEPVAGSPTSTAYPPSNLTVFGTHLYFTGYSPANGREVWHTDGTTTTMLQDINSGNAFSTPADFTEANGFLYFSADDGVNGRELWRTNGTNTELVLDINSSGDSDPDNMRVFGSQLYFLADDNLTGKELWRTDGVTTALALDQNTTTGTGDTWIKGYINVGNTLYMLSERDTSDNNRHEIWRIDPTGVTWIADTSSYYDGLGVYNNQLYFVVYDAVDAHQLWRTTASGIEFAADIEPGLSTFPADFITYNGNLYFTANGNNGRELWRFDGNTALEFADINPGATDSDIASLYIFNGFLYFTATDGVNGQELWRTDGTSPNLVMDIRPGSAGSGDFLLDPPLLMTELNGFLYFAADDGTNGFELWRTNGSITEMAADISTGPASGLDDRDFEFARLGDWLYFLADDGVHGLELWRSNGTTTELAFDVASGSNDSYLTMFTVYNNQLYFIDQYDSRQIYFTDGTSLSQIATGNTSVQQEFNLRAMEIFNNQLFLSAENYTHNNELWRWDGTTLEKITNLATNSQRAWISNLFPHGSRLYMVLDDGIHGTEPWYYEPVNP